jgi:hypothetical protein
MQMADSVGGQTIRCSHCQTLFFAGAADTAIQTDEPTAAKSRTILAEPTEANAEPALAGDEEEHDAVEMAERKSMMPVLLIGCGVLFLLCGGGGSLGGYFAWKAFKTAAEDAVPQLATNEIDVKPRQDTAEQDARLLDAAKEEINDRQRKPQQPRQQQTKDDKEKQSVRPDPPKKVEQNRPTDKPRPADQPKPPPMPPVRDLVQPISLSIPLDAKPFEVLDVLWYGEDAPKALVVLKSDKDKVRLEHFDLASGRKIVGMEITGESVLPSGIPYGTSRDISPDGKYYICKTVFMCTIWALPRPKPLVTVRNDTIAAPKVMGAPRSIYLLGGENLLTAHLGGQVALLRLQNVEGRAPRPTKVYNPPPTEGRIFAPSALALSSDRKRLAVYNGKDGFILLDTKTLRSLGSVRSPQDARSSKDVRLQALDVSFSPDGKQLAAIFHHVPTFLARVVPSGLPQLIRWDANTKRKLASFALPANGAGMAGMFSRIDCWGTEFVWLAGAGQAATLISWEKKAAILDALGCKVFPGSPDGKCWFVVAGPDGKAVLKGIELPTEALQKAEQPLKLTADGIVRK